MKYKKITLLLILSLGLIWANISLAADSTETKKLPFTPSMSIPGLYEAGKSFNVDGSSLPNYIKGIYRYGGIFAGVVAMFVLVYAGWEWLLAGGNSGRISRAKEKINGVLIGLALLFGGYLLLSLISERLVSFESLEGKIILANPPCAAFATESSCPTDKCHWEKANVIMTNSKDLCVDGAVSTKPVCSTQKDQATCESFSNICQWSSGQCAVKEWCSITQEEFTIFADDPKVDASFNVHCCATNLFGGGYSNYRYAIFGNRDFKLSCDMICGGGSPERPLTECKTALGWDGAMDGSGGW